MFNFDLKPRVFENRVRRYFENDGPYTFAGLYLYLGVSKSKWAKLKKDPDYKDACDYAQTKMEEQYEQQLMKGNPTGAIFALKNMGWSDQAKIDLAVGEIVPVEQLLKGAKMKAK
jgi:hypothetical protein